MGCKGKARGLSLIVRLTGLLVLRTRSAEVLVAPAAGQRGSTRVGLALLSAR